MLRTSDSETEILLGNKQLAGIFFVVAALLGIAFYGGYMVGRAGSGNKAAATNPPAVRTAAPSTAAASGGETHSFPSDTASPTPAPDQSASKPVDTASPDAEPPLGSPRRKQAQAAPAASVDTVANGTSAAFTPQAGEQFLQVAAVGKDEAEGVADVLQRKGFLAHAVPKPGTKLYRVLIGPLKDAADLSSTRDALRRTGFREVIVQRY